MHKIEVNLEQLKSLVKNLKTESSKTVAVGVRDMRSESGVSTQEYGKYLEFGWVQRVTPRQSGYLSHQGVHVPAGATLYNPPRPFFRYTIADEEKNWKDYFIKSLVHFSVGADASFYTKSLQMVGAIMVQDIQTTLENGGSRNNRFPPRSPMTMAIYRAISEGHSQDGTGTSSSSQAGISSGLLRDSISFEIQS